MTLLKEIEKRRIRHTEFLYHHGLLHNHAYLTPPLSYRDTSNSSSSRSSRRRKLPAPWGGALGVLVVMIWLEGLIHATLRPNLFWTGLKPLHGRHFLASNVVVAVVGGPALKGPLGRPQENPK